MLAPGIILQNRYQIVRVLGQGGMGAVYLALDLHLGNLSVAVKENSGGDPSQFEQEAILLAGLKHPNLPRVQDHFVLPNGAQYLVMEYVEGTDLDMQLRNGALPEVQVRGWLDQIFDAVAYLHAQRVIHRDIKPANIRITPKGQAMLVDFGLAKVMQSGKPTYTGAKAVTPGFAAPEQYRGGTDARSDIYSLGATMYALLTGSVPPDALALEQGSALLVSPRVLNPRLGPQIEQCILRALQLPPPQRFQNVDAMRQALAAVSPSTSLLPSWRIIAKSVGAGGLIAFAAFALLFTLGILPSPIQSATPTALLSSTPNVTLAAGIPIFTSTPAAMATAQSSATATRTRKRAQATTLIATTFAAPATPTRTPKPNVSGEFAALWNRYRGELGAPKAGSRSAKSFPAGTFAEQRFERGHMFFMRVPSKRILVVVGSQKGGWTGQGNWWKEYPDKFVDGVNDTTTCQLAGDISRQPVGGFGLLWCTNSSVRDALGFSVTQEVDVDRQAGGNRVYLLQEFQNGLIFRDSDGWTNCNRGNCLAYIFFSDGTFRRERY